ncbi:MAG: HEPN domain-containing protein [Flavipsychrobacter sp.]|nr:HEPN domain-containing protein [Flavipsychrobacter sp.]
MANPYLEKSTQNLLTAELLVKNNYYPATVNRAYYSCLQFIFHVLIEKLNHNFEEINEAPRIGTHAQAQYLIGLALAKLDEKEYKWFQAKFPEIKEQRIKADYHTDSISQEIAHDSINRANAIITTLKKLR